MQQVLKPIVCVGELLWERECNITEEVIARQIKLDFFGISAEDLKKCIIAYEPVWAIGTGKTATADQAEEVCAFIRATLAKIYGAGYSRGNHNPVRRLNERKELLKNCSQGQTLTAVLSAVLHSRLLTSILSFRLLLRAN